MDGDFAEVESKDGQVFRRKLQYLFMDADAAKRSRRAWENGRRKAKRR